MIARGYEERDGRESIGGEQEATRIVTGQAPLTCHEHTFAVEFPVD